MTMLKHLEPYSARGDASVLHLGVFHVWTKTDDVKGQVVQEKPTLGGQVFGKCHKSQSSA